MCCSAADVLCDLSSSLEPKLVQVNTRLNQAGSCCRVLALKSDSVLIERGAINAENRQRRQENRKWEERSEVEEEEEQGKARAYRSITSFLTSLGLFSCPQLPLHSPPPPALALSRSLPLRPFPPSHILCVVKSAPFRRDRSDSRSCSPEGWRRGRRIKKRKEKREKLKSSAQLEDGAANGHFGKPRQSPVIYVSPVAVGARRCYHSALLLV